ncbi:MAG: sugar ABC transporter permease [Candidatus Lumbricidophila eiseniae]|uniref:Sugar ABC transporter permease n=1 Tax=Candidatus Lumbricidiphila eiseniae TaxID=1969409 RepID=A0A2A6FQW3_9MICO|nr:MAG: sugar ABC transporter permease [Candidatus Lumbricidophila eiseniae]
MTALLEQTKDARRRTRRSRISAFDSAMGWQSGWSWSNVIRTILIVIAIAIFAVPFIGVFVGAFDASPTSLQFSIIPKQFSFEPWKAAIDRGVLRFFLNSLVIVGGGLVLQIATSIAAAYAIARYRFRGAGIALGLFLLTMMLPEDVIAVPLSQVLGSIPLLGLNLRGTVFAVILPVAAWGFSTLVMAEFMRDIPKEIEEVARLDGVGEFRMLVSIVLPMSIPALGVATVFGFIMIWDQYLLPLIAANGPEDYTLTVALRGFRQDYDTGSGVLMVGSLLALLPSLIVYLLLQRSLVRGIVSGATKG